MKKEKRELVPFSDMLYVEGSLEVWRRLSEDGYSGDWAWPILVNIRNTYEKNRPHHSKVKRMKDVSIGGINDAFDKFYDIEGESELPLPEELKEMKTLGERMGLGDFTPLNLSKVLKMYYNVMELADDFDIADPYDQIETENTNQ